MCAVGSDRYMGQKSYPSLNVLEDTHEWMAEFRDANGHKSMDEAVSELIAYYEGEIEPQQNNLDEATIEQLVDELGAAVGGPAVDDSNLAREVAARIDYAELARKTADNVLEEVR